MDYFKMLLEKEVAEKKIYEILDSFNKKTGFVVQGITYRFNDIKIEILSPR
jgi:hypothetical protein